MRIITQLFFSFCVVFMVTMVSCAEWAIIGGVVPKAFIVAVRLSQTFINAGLGIFVLNLIRQFPR